MYAGTCVFPEVRADRDDSGVVWAAVGSLQCRQRGETEVDSILTWFLDLADGRRLGLYDVLSGFVMFSGHF